ncbi:hypothetical protein DVH24_034324, partial [Malus domestica]
VDGARSLGLLSFPALAVSPFPFKEWWTNPPSTDGVDGVLSPGCLPMYHEPLSYDLGPYAQDLPKLQIKFQIWWISPQHFCTLCAWYRLRTRNVVIGIGVIWHFFLGIVTVMGSSCAPCDDFSWFFYLHAVFTVLTVYTVGEAMFRVIRFFCVVTFGPLQLGLKF